jgi:hypothetical protein
MIRHMTRKDPRLVEPTNEPTAPGIVAAPVEAAATPSWDGRSIDRWLVLPDAGARADRSGTGAGNAYGVALTASGRFAVVVRPVDGGRNLVVSEYDSLDDIPTDELPDNVRELAARQLGQRFVVLLDG